MNFIVSKPFYVIVALLILIICLCAFGLLNQSTIIVEPTPVEPNVAVNVQSAVPDVIVESQINVYQDVYEQRYTEELVIIAMKNKDYPWLVQVLDGKYQIFPEYQDKGIWIVTVDFQSFSRQYIFDEGG